MYCEYYHFLATDRILTQEEMDYLRRFSTRAIITPTAFTNHYSFGSPGFISVINDWLARFFQIYVHSDTAGCAEVRISVPRAALPPEETAPFSIGRDPLVVYEGNTAILRLAHYVEDWDEPVEGDSGGLAGLATAVRQGLLAGDRRALYLGWLLEAQEHAADDDLEPPVPPGLGELDGPLRALLDGIGLDPDLLQVAAENSAPLRPVDPSKLKKWVASLAAAEKDEVLIRLAGGDAQAALDWQVRWTQEAHALAAQAKPKAPRCFAEIWEKAEGVREERLASEREKARIRELRAQKQAAQREEARIAALAGRESELWAQVEEAAAGKRAHYIKQVVKLLVDLRALHERQPTAGFPEKLSDFWDRHLRRHALIKAMLEAGLRPSRVGGGAA